MFGERLSRTTKPIQSPMNLDAGAPNARQAVSLSLFVMGCIFTMTLSGGIVLWSIPPTTYQWNSVRFLGALFGGSMLFISAGFGVTMYSLSIGLWKDYRARLADWHEAVISSAEAAYGVETTVSYDRWHLQPDNFSHIWAIVSAAHAAYHNENVRLYTRRELEQPLFASMHGRQVRLGALSGSDPEKVGTLLTQLGLIEGRSSRVAGEWKPTSLEEAYALTIKNWSKL